MKSLSLRFAAVPLALMLSTGVAFAHAHLRSAVPPVGATVTTAPKEIVINFSEEVEPHFCSVAVTDAAGQRVDTGDLHTAPGNARQLVAGVKPLAAGTYTVVWHATAVDTHKTEGKYTFTVGH